MSSIDENNSSQQKLFSLLSKATYLELEGDFDGYIKILMQAKKIAGKIELHRIRAEIIRKELMIKIK